MVIRQYRTFCLFEQVFTYFLTLMMRYSNESDSYKKKTDPYLSKLSFKVFFLSFLKCVINDAMPKGIMTH